MNGRLSFAFLALIGVFAVGAQEKKDNASSLVVGKPLPFHVVDFVKAKNGHCGCSSVMIGNSKRVGVEIFARSNHQDLFRLVAVLQSEVPAHTCPNCYSAI